MAMSPALMGSASAATPNTTQNQSPQQGGDPSQGAMPDLMGKIRQVASSVDDLGASNPALAPEIQQIKAILRQMIIKSASAASVQTPSGQAVPMAGQ